MARPKRAWEDESPLQPHSDKRARASRVERSRLSPPPPPTVPLEFTCESVCGAARTSIEELLAAASSASQGASCVDQILDGARVIYLTEDKSSWLYHAPGWYKRLYETLHPHEQSYSEWVDAVWDLHPMHHDAIKMFGKDVLMPRFQQVYGQSYRFSGTLFEAKPFPELLLHALTRMQQLVVHPASRETYVRAGLVNWYEHGDHYMGPHSDGESNIHAHSPVFSLSLGATRRFVFTVRPKAVSTGGIARLEMILNDGDLLVMGGTTQKTHKHALPKMKKCRDKRISVTLRCFK